MVHVCDEDLPVEILPGEGRHIAGQSKPVSSGLIFFSCKTHGGVVAPTSRPRLIPVASPKTSRASDIQLRLWGWHFPHWNFQKNRLKTFQVDRLLTFSRPRLSAEQTPVISEGSNDLHRPLVFEKGKFQVGRVPLHPWPRSWGGHRGPCVVTIRTQRETCLHGKLLYQEQEKARRREVGNGCIKGKRRLWRQTAQIPRAVRHRAEIDLGICKGGLSPKRCRRRFGCLGRR